MMGQIVTRNMIEIYLKVGMSFNFGMDGSHKKCGGSTCSKIEILKFSFQQPSFSFPQEIQLTTAQTAEKEHFLGARACARATRRGARAVCKGHKKRCKGLRIFQNFKSCFQHHIIECSVSLRCKGHMRGARASDLCKGLIFCLFTYILMIITMIWCKGPL